MTFEPEVGTALLWLFTCDKVGMVKHSQCKNVLCYTSCCLPDESCFLVCANFCMYTIRVAPSSFSHSCRDKIIMGPERRSAVIEEKNRQLVAYHEGGHAIVALFTSESLPVYKATIMPRGQALGMVGWCVLLSTCSTCMYTFM